MRSNFTKDGAYRMQWDQGHGCAYCGQPANEREHVHPFSAGRHLATADTAGLMVWACRECNAIARDRVFDSLDEKREFIHQRLRHKHAQVLNRTPWTDAEIGELAGSLRRHVKSQNRKQRVALARIAHLCDGSCGPTLDLQERVA